MTRGFPMRWHRRAGLVAGVLIVVAAVTGLLINHADALGFAQRHLHAGWLLRWYGLPAPQLRGAYAVEGHWLSQWDAQLWIDDRRVDAPEVDGVRAFLALGALRAVVDRHQLLVFTAGGEPVDRLSYPDGFVAQRAGMAAGRLIVEDGLGGRVASDPELTTLHAADGAEVVDWAAPGELPAALRARVQTRAGAGVSVERVLLDVHSGRWLGRAGVWLMDLAALVLLWLAATGAWTVWRRWRRRA